MKRTRPLVATTLVVLAAVLLGEPAHGGPSSTRTGLLFRGSASAAPSACEDFAQNQINLADRLLSQSKYSRALRVLNSTARNCDIEQVRQKIAEVLGEWYVAVRGQGTGALQQFLNVLGDQQHISAAQKSRLEQRVAGQIRGLIQQQYGAEDYRGAHRLCRRYSEYTSDNFEMTYYCGRSADEAGAEGAAMNDYGWLVQNWDENQSLANWEEMTGRLEELYFLNGRFRAAYELARRQARRNPSPKAILSSLISARGHFLAPALRSGSIFYESQPSDAALSLVETELKKVNFPKYVKAIYILKPDGSLQKGMYGNEANEPSRALLETTSSRISLLQSKGDSELAWLVSPVQDRYLVLEFGGATTPEENVRLETVYENVKSDDEWRRLYDLEFEETSPATGSAIGTFLSGARTGNSDLSPYADLFDDSALLTYYCIQDQTGTIVSSHNFDRVDLGYGDSEWQRSSNTPALYHHRIQYDGTSLREVVWPRFNDDNWTGVVRVGLTQS